jgi:hypothetical protein
LYRGIERASGARTVVDSTKHPSTAALLRSLGVDLRIVHMVRDPRGVAYSWTKRQPRPGIAGGAMMDRYPPWRSAVRWVGFNAAFHLLGAMRVPSERVRYEDLVEQPVSILEKATAIAGEARTAFPFIRGTTVSMAEAHTIAGNPMRFDRGALELRRDDAWRSRLSAANRRVVVAIAFPMMVAYGYIGRQASSPR